MRQHVFVMIWAVLCSDRLFMLAVVRVLKISSRETIFGVKNMAAFPKQLTRRIVEYPWGGKPLLICPTPRV
jgi:hypothetical protein